MLKSVLSAIGGAMRAMAVRAGAVIAALAVYVAMIGAVYVFITTREATIIDLLLTFSLPAAALVFFFFIQAVGVRYAGAAESTAAVLRGALRDTGKLLVVSLPPALLAILAVLLLGLIAYWWRGENQYDNSGFVLEYLLPWVRALVLYFAAPLLAVRLWIAASRDGVTSAFRALGRHFVGAFAPRVLVVYVSLLVVFGSIVWALVGIKTQYGGAGLEIGLLTARLAAAGLMIFIGWLLTIGALRRVSDEK
ncbi:MAG: hypothetical protein KIT57_23545 [Blastocatellales bacterium]|nr:hypothetical protein [Blastocatellales bacterium]